MTRKKGGGDRRRGGKKIMEMGDAWDAAVRGSRRKSVTPYQQAKAVLKAKGGDERAAMEALGIKDKRTWKAWTAKDPKARRQPSAQKKAQLNKVYNSSETRRASLPSKRVDRFKRKGMKVTIGGMQGPVGGGKSYQRIREITHGLDGAAAERVMDAFVDGGYEAATGQLQEELMRDDGNGYLAGQRWEFGELTKFSFKDGGSDDFDNFDE